MIKPSAVNSLPTSPGCYLFVDENKKVLYVGKAKNLKKRVSNYFQKKSHDQVKHSDALRVPRNLGFRLDPKTQLLVTHIRGIDFIVTSTEAEAFLLENNLIKLHYPKFNLDLKD